MTLHLLSSVTRFGDDIEISVSATITRSRGYGADIGSGWVVKDMRAATDEGAILLTVPEMVALRERFVELAGRET